MIDVQKTTLGGLEENPFAVPDRLQEEAGGIGNVPANLFGMGQVFVAQIVGIENTSIRGQSAEQLIFPGNNGVQTSAKVFWIEQLT
jgi:hypothetical protein